MVAFACGRGACWASLTTERYAGKRPARHLKGFKSFKGLKPVKRQPWTPIRSHCCGRGDALSHCCGLVVAFACGRGACWASLTTERYAGKRPARHFKGFKGFKGFKFEACQTAALNAYKKPLLRPGGCLEPLLWPCGGFCLRAWRLLGFPNDRALCRQTAGEAF